MAGGLSKDQLPDGGLSRIHRAILARRFRLILANRPAPLRVRRAPAAWPAGSVHEAFPIRFSTHDAPRLTRITAS